MRRDAWQWVFLMIAASSPLVVTPGATIRCMSEESTFFLPALLSLPIELPDGSDAFPPLAR